jgi:hypothetical protein
MRGLCRLCISSGPHGTGIASAECVIDEPPTIVLPCRAASDVAIGESPSLLQVERGLRRALPFVLVIAGAALLSVPAFLNGFPFIFPDSGDYLVFTPHIYRSPYYGIFIFLFHLNRFIWAPILMQGLISSVLLWMLVHVQVHTHRKFCFSFLTLSLTIFSSLPYFTGFIMADIFTPLMFVIMYLIAFHYQKYPLIILVFLLLIDCVATASHISNLSMAVSILPLFAILFCLRRIPLCESMVRIGLIALPIALTTAAVLIYNITIFGNWSISPSGQSFLMANMIQYGPAREYLNEACPSAGYEICQYRSTLPPTADELLWSSGLFDRLGGFVGMEKESKAIVSGTMKHESAATGRMIANNFMSALFTHEPAEEFRSSYQVPSFVKLLKQKFGQATVGDYLRSAEMQDKIPHLMIRNVDKVIVPTSFIFLIILGVIANWRRRSDDVSLSVIVLSAVLGNALLCATISGLHDRYQARMTWLLPMAVFLIAWDFFRAGQQQKRLTDTLGPLGARCSSIMAQMFKPGWRGIAEALNDAWSLGSSLACAVRATAV